MHIGRLTDYAFVLLTHMGRHPHQWLTARCLAHQTGLPSPTVSRLLKTLVGKGLLVSRRGVKGGYTLPPSSLHLSLADVIEALEGPIALTHCLRHQNCFLSAKCHMRAPWERMNRTVRQALSSIPLFSGDLVS